MGREGGKEQKRWGTGVTEKALFPNPAKGMCRKGCGYFPQVNDELRWVGSEIPWSGREQSVGSFDACVLEIWFDLKDCWTNKILKEDSCYWVGGCGWNQGRVWKLSEETLLPWKEACQKFIVNFGQRQEAERAVEGRAEDHCSGWNCELLWGPTVRDRGGRTGQLSWDSGCP